MNDKKSVDAKTKSSIKGKLVKFLILVVVISSLFTLIMQLDFMKEFFGVDYYFSNSFNILKLIFVIILSIIVIAVLVVVFLRIYKKLPMKGDIISQGILLQKKILFPRYRVTILVKVKGIPREIIKNIQNERNNSESTHLVSSDIISALSQGCNESSFWILKQKNRINLYFTVSGWAWFSKNSAMEKAKQALLVLEASFNNVYPSIQLSRVKEDESNGFFQVLDECSFGLEATGVPAYKSTQSQLDRLINTFSALDENSFFVVSMTKVRKGQEKISPIHKLKRESEKEEFLNDLKEAKKSGQSKVGIYAYTQSENGMYTVLAALLSIWSGTNTFKVNKLGNSQKRNNHKSTLRLNPEKKQRLSNKAVSSFVHLPEKPFFTENTGQPIFDIPTFQDEKKNTQNICIGNIIKNDKILDEFLIPLRDFHFNLEIVGMIGRGKSYLVATIFEQLLEIDIGCLVFDLKGEYSKLFIEESDVIVYTIGPPAPLGINLFQINSEGEVQNVLALINEMLTIAGSPFSPTMLNIFETALQKITKRENKNLEEFMYCLSESSTEYSTNMRTSYSKESIDAILNRLNFIFGGVNYEIFSVLNNTINFQALDEGKKIIIDLSEYLRRGASTASLFLACNLVLHLLSKYASQKGITNQLRYLVILEEAMYQIPKRFNLESAASQGYSEQNFIIGRSLGIGTIAIYQIWDSVSNVLHANSLTKILFRSEDTEKIRNAIALTEEQFDFLPHLPDRNCIVKSKSSSGPILLKTKTFLRNPVTTEDYLSLARKKFEDNGFTYRRISKNLMELREHTFYRNKDKKNNWKLGSKNKSEELNSRIQKTRFNNFSWENCINTCPARVIYKDKRSSWIKTTYCTEIQKKAFELSKELWNNEKLKPLFVFAEKKPNYLSEKLLEYFVTEDTPHPELLTFCTMNFLLEEIRKTLDKNNRWKNELLRQIRLHILANIIPKSHPQA